MNRFSIFAAALTLALATAPAAAPAHATSIQKCRSADGSVGYTDGSCKVFGSDSVTVSSRLLEATVDTSLAASFPAMDLKSTGLGMAPGRRSPASGCARTPTQLAMDLRASLALGDVNRVAESYHWVGMSNEDGQRTLDRLQTLIGRPVIDSHYLEASYGIGGGALYATAGPAATTGGEAGMLQLLLGDDDGLGASSIDFDVHRYAGCYFVSF